MQNNFTVTFCKVLDQTMKEFGITGRWLAEQSGVSEQAISNTRNGKVDIKTSTLDKLVFALPPHARDYYFDQLNPQSRTLRSLILKSSKEEKAEVLELIAKSLVSSITEEGKVKIAV